jgi:hypothetical protein
MRRPTVFLLLIAALLLVGVAMAIVATVDGSTTQVLAGVGLALLGGATYLADRRSRTARRSLELRLERGFDAVRKDVTAVRQDMTAVRQNLTGVPSRQDLAEVTERLDRLDFRLEKTQRRLVAASDAARVEAAERGPRISG